MTDIEKFEGFKEKMIDENEKNYGTEIREKYGKDIIVASNKNLKICLNKIMKIGKI